VEFTRQYVLKDDIQQVHLVVNFARASLEVPAGEGNWSFDLPGRDRSSRLAAWIDEVEASTVYRAAAHTRALAFDVWQDSAD
jgi:hypothetical protein